MYTHLWSYKIPVSSLLMREVGLHPELLSVETTTRLKEPVVCITFPKDVASWSLRGNPEFRNYTFKGFNNLR
jgi:hypothetical protein